MKQQLAQPGVDKIDFQQFRPAQNLSLPNLISALRLLLIPVIVSVYLSGQSDLAALLLVISFFSDIVDGFIARRFHQITPLGKVLDPIADKLTQVVLTIAMCFNFRQTVPLVIVLIIKELVMLLLGLRMLKQGCEPISARWWGKLSTGAFYLGITIIMVACDYLPDNGIWLISGLVCALMLFSLLRYVMLFLKKPILLAKDDSI